MELSGQLRILMKEALVLTGQGDGCAFDMIYLLTAIGMTSDGSSTEHIYTQTIHRTTQSTQTIHRTTQLTN
jgi:hypothetical protein